MRLLLVVAGHLCVSIGVIGIFLPLLPTTPFLLLAAFLYSKGSRRLHLWLMRHSTLGPPIRNWHLHGVISRPAKAISVALITVSLSYPLLFSEMNVTVKWLAALTGIAVCAFLLTRPSAPTRSTTAER